jgi:hypothetical protein
MKKVFVSYSRKDLTFVKKLADDLQKAGMDVWFDMSDLKGGDHWIKAIQQGIESSQYCIIVLSPDSIESEWVANEYLHAKDSKIKLVPIMHRPCKIPLALKGVQFIDLQGANYAEHFDELLQVLDVKARDDQKIAQTDSARITFDWRIGAGLIAILALIAIGIGIALTNQPPVTIDPTLTPSATLNLDRPPTETITPTLTLAPIITPTTTMTLTPTITFTPEATVTPQFNHVWKTDCLYSAYWSSFSSSAISLATNCWDLTSQGMYLKNAVLFLDQPQAGRDQTVGIYTPISGNVEISLDLTIDRLSIPSSGSFANIALGIVPSKPGDLSVENLFFYEVEKSTDKTLALKTEERGSARSYIYDASLYARRYTYGAKETVKFVIENNRLSVYRGDRFMFDEDITYRSRAFWIGFHVTKGARMWAELSGIKIVQK